MIASRPSNRSAVAKVAPVFSPPASGWLPRKRQPWPRPVSSAATIDSFVLPTSVINARSGQCSGGLADMLDDMADRRANDHQFGLGHALVQVDGRMGHGTDAACNPQTGLAAADANDIFRQISLAQRQPDRPADQSDSHDGDGIPLFHVQFPALFRG